jgi:hypothetical protein
MGAPMMIGAALGGGLSAARGGNPLLGALLGGVGGGVFGAAGGGAAAAANAGAGLAPAATGLKMGATTGLKLGASTGMGSLAGSAGLPASAGLAPGVANLAPPAMTGYGLTPAATSVGFMDTMQRLPKEFMQFSRENPFATNLASNAAQEEFRQKEVSNPGLLRGRPADEQAMQYSSPIPKLSLL